jgi:hypothetical protein
LKEEVEQRFEKLKQTGKSLLFNIPRDNDLNLNYYIDTHNIPEYQAWISSSVNLIRFVARPNTYFVEECQRLVTDEKNGRYNPHSRHTKNIWIAKLCL